MLSLKLFAPASEPLFAFVMCAQWSETSSLLARCVERCVLEIDLSFWY